LFSGHPGPRAGHLAIDHKRPRFDTAFQRLSTGIRPRAVRLVEDVLRGEDRFPSGRAPARARRLRVAGVLGGVAAPAERPQRPPTAGAQLVMVQAHDSALPNERNPALGRVSLHILIQWSSSGIGPMM